jgi:Sec-independent protein secretion pathway component TatC
MLAVPMLLLFELGIIIASLYYKETADPEDVK